MRNAVFTWSILALMAAIAQPALGVTTGGLTLLGRANVTSTNGPLGVCVDGNYAFAACGSGGLVVLDVSNVNAPRQVGSLTAPHGINDVVLIDHYLYSPWIEASTSPGGSGGLQIIDISTPTNPVLCGSYAGTDWGNDVAVANGKAYLAEPTGLRILDVSNPSSPTLCGVPR